MTSTFIKEDAIILRLWFVKHVAHHHGSHANVLVHQLVANDANEHAVRWFATARL